MKDSGKKYKIVWRDGEVTKVRYGHSYDYRMDTNPWLIMFHADNDEEYVINSTYLIAIEPASEK